MPERDLSENQGSNNTHMPELSNRALITPPSPIRSLAALATQAEQKGRSVYRINIGQPDVHSPESFRKGVADYSHRVVAYETSEGNFGLRAAWAKYMSEELSLDFHPDEMLITVGASEALIFTFWACCDPGDEILILDPTYANYIGFAAVTGTKLVPVTTLIENEFAMPSMSDIEACITSKTKAILICNPNNPTGTVYSDDELRKVHKLCEDRNLFFVIDETYREIVYDNRSPLSLFHLEPQSERVVMIDSLSKRFSLCGARIGCLYTRNQEVRARVLNMAQARLAAPTIEQHAARFMLENLEADYFQSVRATYEKRRDVLCEALKSLPDTDCYSPDGAFYTVARLPVERSDAFARFLLSEFDVDGETVFISPAAGFYMEGSRGQQKIRLAFVLEEEKLQRSVEIIKLGLEAFLS